MDDAEYKRITSQDVKLWLDKLQHVLYQADDLLDDKEKIINKLLFSGTGSATVNEIPVIPIQGMGGIGKTTLAQSVYNDARVSRNFPIRSWVCVSDAFDVFMITKFFFDDVTSSYNNIDNLDRLHTKLKESLARKTFLIVLDDVWNDNPMDWDALSKPFRSGKKPIYTHRLGLLPVPYCWALFAKHAFVNGDYMAHLELESIGRDIVNKCGRLPLAVKSLGNLLGSKSKLEEWEDVLESKIWDSDPNISAALRISYFDLPSHLKQCFAYCSVFPKDYQFKVEKLVQLWIALDFVQQPKNGKSVEDKGKDYFDQLLSRSFFQRLSHDNDSHFVMHDLVHDLALDISGDFCCRLDRDQPLVGISENAVHFSYVRGEYEAFHKFKVVNEVKCLRTFMSYSKEEWFRPCYLGNKVLNDILLVQISLRVLSLSTYDIFELPESIENLIHLRYLDVSRTRIKQLPDSVTSLCNLLRLDLSICRRHKKLPMDVGKLINLRRLDMKETKLTEMPVQISKLKELRHLDLSDCRLLTKLPVDMATLINLRHLDIRGTRLTEMPAQMTKLKELRQLSCFVVGKNSGSSISELKELRHLSGDSVFQG